MSDTDEYCACINNPRVSRRISAISIIFSVLVLIACGAGFTFQASRNTISNKFTNPNSCDVHNATLGGGWTVRMDTTAMIAVPPPQNILTVDVSIKTDNMEKKEAIALIEEINASIFFSKTF